MNETKEIERIALSVSEVATALGVSARTVRSLLKEGSLPCIRIGTRVLVEVEEVRKFINRRRGN